MSRATASLCPASGSGIEAGWEDFPAKVSAADGEVAELLLHVQGLTPDEQEICSTAA